jgi:fatty-acid desaturase
MFKSISKYTYFSFIPFSILGTVAVVLSILKIIPAYYLLFTLVSWVLISGLGVAAGYHRIFSHKNYAGMPIWKENIILFFGALSGQGSSISWTTIHRGYHHAHTDTDRDLHSPIHGKWYAFFTWATKITEENNVINMKYAVDLLRLSLIHI